MAVYPPQTFSDEVKEKIMSMAEMKRNIYFGLKQMIFGFAGAGENRSIIIRAFTANGSMPVIYLIHRAHVMMGTTIIMALALPK